MATEFSLMDKYLKKEGNILLNGVQALVRLPIEQMRMDQKAGLRTGVYISGYQGSPLGELDKQLKGIERELRRHNIIWQAGINEDIAATAVYGSQMLHMFPHAQTEAVVGIWYGKTPGLDRSGDAFRHGTFLGASPNGGYLALVGDDPACKSSTLPGDSTLALYDLVMPTFFPSGPREMLEYGLHAIAMSRYSGAWGALKVVTNVADGGEMIEVHPQLVNPVIPQLDIDGKPFAHVQETRLLPPYSVEIERHLHNERLIAAMAYVRANRLDRITVQSGADIIGLVAAGKTYRDLVHTLDWLGLNEQALQQAGIRLYKLAMVTPVEPEGLKQFVAGLDDVVVVEEKRGFIETQMRGLLYNQPKRPRIWGKRDERDAPMFPLHGELSLESIGLPLAGFLARRLGRDDLLIKAKQLAEIAGRSYEPIMTRTPFFCSGCPHNASTVREGDELVGGGIGCHSMAVYMDRGVVWLTQMGGEGAPWLGISPFTEQKHILQNIGDGTFFHSGSKSLEACVSAGVDVTFRILYNGTVAMTGGQDVEGGLTTQALAKKLVAGGVKKVCIVAESLEAYKGGGRLDAKITLHPRANYSDVLRDLRKVQGVSVVIYDQQCAAEKRRMRKRGQLSTPPKRVYINQSVCEGCGDCGVRSNCLSVVPVETDYGRKTSVHLPSCNFDYTCLQGDCPAFMSVELSGDASPIKRSSVPVTPSQGLEDPKQMVALNAPYKILLIGVGGTGVVTVNALLSTAAAMEEKQVMFLDQTGLSQKGGAVLSNLVLSNQPIQHSNKIGAGETDLLLGFDLLASVSPDNLNRYSAKRTCAVVNTHTLYTGESVTNIHAVHPQQKAMLKRLEAYTRRKDNLLVDALAICEALFGDHMPSNVFMLGVAWQLGRLPLKNQSIVQAITLNGVAVEANLSAFYWGRWFVQNRQKVMDAAFGSSAPQETQEQAQQRLMRFAPNLLTAWKRALAQIPDHGTLRSITAPRLADLMLYQGNTQLADRYTHDIKQVLQGETQALQSSALTEAFARWYFKLLAVKDEYETARLWLQDPAWEQAKAEYHGKVKRYVYLHPPMLKRWGLKTKIRFGRSSRLLFGVLYALRFLRGGALDLFNSKHRRLERSLASWYLGLIVDLLPKLTHQNRAIALKIASLPDVIRGYEDIKEGNIEQAKEQAKTLLKAFSKASIPKRKAS